jgi:hypothetical protein
VHLWPGLPLFLAVAAPWYVAMLGFSGRDAEGKTFFQRFFLHDHVGRLLHGVHTTTPGGTFTYFLEQGGFATFPWVVLVPGALALVSTTPVRQGGARERLTLFAALWTCAAFSLVSLSATRYHHYVLPVLPGLALLVALFADRLLADGVRPHLGALGLGLVLLVLVGKDVASTPRHFIDLFSYNYERPYPGFLLTRALRVGEHRVLVGDVVALAAGALGLARVRRAPTTGALLGLGGFCAWVLSHLPRAPVHLSRGLDTHAGLGLATAACALVVAWGMVKTHSRALVGGVSGMALGLAVWLGASHWVDMSHHWTQRDLFWRYWRMRQPGEPIAAFLMDWKGETFYSRNTVVQIRVPEHQRGEARRLAEEPGRAWFLVEHPRLGVLRQALGPGHTLRTVAPDLNNKFVLVVVD